MYYMFFLSKVHALNAQTDVYIFKDTACLIRRKRYVDVYELTGVHNAHLLYFSR